MKSYSVIAAIALSIAISGCGASTPAPSATLVPALPGCDVTGDTYRLDVRQPQPPLPPAEESLWSPDGTAHVFQNADGTYVDSGTGAPIRAAETHLGDGNALNAWARWSHDGRKVAIVYGGEKYTESLDIAVVDLDTSAQTELNANLNHPADFWYWSPNDRYLVMNSTLRDLQLWDWRQNQMTYTAPGLYIVDYNIQWSPDGDMIAYYWRDDIVTGTYPPYGYSIANADGSSETRITISDHPAYNSSFGGQYSWSPDGKHIIFSFWVDNGSRTPFKWTSAVHSRDGARVMEVPLLPIYNDTTATVILPRWSTTSLTLANWESQPNGDYRLRLYPLDGSDPISIVDAEHSPYYSISQTRMGVIQRENGHLSLDLMDIDGSNRRHFVEEADEIDNVQLSPGGRWFAAVVRATDGTRLRWSDTEGNNAYEINAEHEIGSLQWSPNDRFFAFVNSLPDGEQQVVWANAETGEYRVLRDKLIEVTRFGYSEPSAAFVFAWTTDESRGYAGFTVDGVLAFDYPGIFSASALPSPDGRFTAVKGAADDGERLLIVDQNSGEVTLLAQGLSGLGDPLWSPDSEMVAYTWAINRGPVMLDAANTVGDIVWTGRFDWLYNELVWITCDEG